VICGKRLAVVLPAYEAARTLHRVLDALPAEGIDDLILVDDGSTDDTVALAQARGLFVHVHPQNRGYGANQKSCYRLALERGADLVVMLHPDDQYPPELVLALAEPIARGRYDVMLGSRVLGAGARAGGMPLYKYVANRALTFVENVLLDYKLSEYHTGFRAWSRRSLQLIDWMGFEDGFVFDNEMLVAAIRGGLRVGELSVGARYPPDASSIGFVGSVSYGLGVLRCAMKGRRWG
jgi:glycosyltransferase involved in cell wall biosynthesis